MTNEIQISQFKGTPLYALAQNANVYRGDTLNALEFSIMQQQMKNLGMTFDEFNLEVNGQDLAGKNAKETRNNISDIGTELNKAYKRQFDSKADVSSAHTAENKADSTIKTAMDMFNSQHPEIKFAPKSLGARPHFTSPEYKNNVTQYAVDLNNWANSVKEEYMQAATKSTQEIVDSAAGQIIFNNNLNTAITLNKMDEVMVKMDELSEDVKTALDELSQEIQEGKAEILEQIQTSEGNIKQTVRRAAGQVISVVRSAEGHIIGVVRQEGQATRNTVRVEHHMTRGYIKDVGQTLSDQMSEGFTNTNNHIAYQSSRIINNQTDMAQHTQEIGSVSNGIQTALNDTHIGSTTKEKATNLEQNIINSNLPHNDKMLYLNNIEQIIKNGNSMNDKLDNLQKDVNDEIDKYETRDHREKSTNKTPTYTNIPDPLVPFYGTFNFSNENNISSGPAQDSDNTHDNKSDKEQ